MLRKLLSLICFMCLSVPVVFAQSGSISGTVTDAKTGEPVASANIYIQQINRGAATNVDGEYSITSIPVGTYKIRVTFVGYKTKKQQFQVQEGNNELNVSLKSGSLGLDNIVVTAQGLKIQKKEIGASITTVKGSDVSRVKSGNLVNDLAGKVPGVDITSQSGTAGGSSRIVIRGNSKLSGNTQPLFVVDGVPVYNTNLVGSTSDRLSGGAVDVGNRASDINPDNIEDITVLRGASAAALYGQRAQNGVILITTKRGTKGGDTEVTINSSFRVNKVQRLPDFQNEYGPGNDGKYNATSTNGWGPKIEGQKVEQFPFTKEPSGPNGPNPNGGTVRPLNAHPDNVDNLLKRGANTVNSFAIAGGSDEGGDFRLSYTNSRSEGIVPNNTLHRNNISLNAGKQFSDKLSARATAKYILSNGQGRPVQGGNSSNAFIPLAYGLQRTISASRLRNNVKEKNGDQIGLTPSSNNPYWVTRNNGLDDEINRFIGSGKFTFSPQEWISFTGRAGVDTYTDTRSRPTVKGTYGALKGRYSADDIQLQQIDATLLVNLKPKINSDDFSIDATLGGNLNTRQREVKSNQASDLIVDGLYNYGNAKVNSPTNGFYQKRLVGVFAKATLGYQDYLFLNVTGRNDWSSTLPDANNSFFYPSANLSFVFTDAFDIDNSVLSYGKIRLGAAEVGSDEAPYQLSFSYRPDQTIFGQFGTDIIFPLGDANAFTATTTSPPSNLKPQRQVSLEVGTELGFFNGRVNLNFTAYRNETRDQIISIPVPQSTGFNANRTNAGTIRNEGIEALLDVTPIRTQNFQWNSSFSYTKNELTVEKLAPGLDEVSLPNTGFNGIRNKAKPGTDIGIYGTGFKKNDDGKYIIDPSTGLRQTGTEVRLGSQDPDWQLGINNSFSYKYFTLNFLIDISKGGTIVSGTEQSLFSSGLTQETADMRNKYSDPAKDFIQDGVIEKSGGGFKKNDVPVTSIEAYYQNLYQNSIYAASTYDASYVKLREVSLGYTLPRKWLKSTFISSATLSVIGRNLWLIYADVPAGIDPEANVFGSDAIAQGFEFNNIPTSRSLGAKIKVRF